MKSDRILLNDLLVRSTIGIHQPERANPQDLILNAELRLDLDDVARSDRIEDTIDYGVLTRNIVAYVESSERHTVEALAYDVAAICLADSRAVSVRVLVEKPGAHRYAKSLGVEIERTRTHLRVEDAFIVLGSNEEPEGHLPAAVSHLSTIGDVHSVSGVYEAPDASGQSDAPYVNAAVRLRSILPPLEIRRRLKGIESHLGRTRNSNTVPIDLDLSLVGDLVLTTPTFRLPSEEITSCPHVAATLAEIAPEFLHPVLHRSLTDIANDLTATCELRLRSDIALP